MRTNERPSSRGPSESPARATENSVEQSADNEAGAPSTGARRRPSVESQFLTYVCEQVEVFRAQDGQAYGARLGSPQRAIAVQELVGELALEYYAVNQTYPNSKIRATAADLLHAQAAFGGIRPVYLRSAWLTHEGQVLIDTGHDEDVICASSTGWTVRSDEHRVAFRRTPTMQELTIADKAMSLKAGLRLLRELVPVAERDVSVLLALLLTSWLTAIPQPIVLVSGPRDSGKTSTARFLLSLVDPTTHVRGGGLPAKEAGWKAAANTARVQLIENLGHVEPATSDILCRVASGGEITSRKLYSDDTAHVTSLQIPVWLTSVDPGVLREDLASRIVNLALQPLDAGNRLAESELKARQDAARPKLTRFLLDLLVRVLDALPNQTSAGLTHRMGDFELILRCLDDLLDSDGAARLHEQALELAASVLEADPIAQAVIRYADHELPEPGEAIQCTPTDLLRDLTALNEHAAWARGWPRSPGVLSTHLARIAPTLEETHGVRVMTGIREGKAGTRYTRIERLPADGPA